MRREELFALECKNSLLKIMTLDSRESDKGGSELKTDVFIGYLAKYLNLYSVHKSCIVMALYNTGKLHFTQPLNFGIKLSNTHTPFNL